MKTVQQAWETMLPDQRTEDLSQSAKHIESDQGLEVIDCEKLYQETLERYEKI